MLTKNKNSTKKTYSTFLMLFLLNLLITILFFVDIQTNHKELGICDYYKEYSFSFGESQSAFKYPMNQCDDRYYFNAVKDFHSLFNESGNVYQNRPLFILGVSSIKSVLGVSLITYQNESIPILEFLIFQLILITISQLLMFKIVEFFKDVSKINILYLTLITMIFPLYRFEIFKTSNQTFALLIFVLPIYYIITKKSLGYSEFFIMGLLFLFNRSFFISFVFILLHEFHKIKKTPSALMKYFSTIFTFFIPAGIYRFYIIFNNLENVDVGAQTYGQFIWINNYFVRYGNALSLRILSKPKFNYKNFDSDLHCVSVPENFICYFKDSLITLEYLLGGVLIILFFTFFTKIPNLLLNKLAIVTVVGCLFWSLIGWYPLIRLNLYTLGISMTMLAFFQITFLRNFYLKVLLLLSWCGYFYFIDHWNIFI